MVTQVVVPVYTVGGELHDAEHRVLATEEYVDGLLEDFVEGYGNMPAHYTIVLTKAGGVWPGVPTTRSDIVIIWRGALPAPPTVTSRTLGQAGLLQGVDIGLFV